MFLSFELHFLLESKSFPISSTTEEIILQKFKIDLNQFEASCKTYKTKTEMKNRKEKEKEKKVDGQPFGPDRKTAQGPPGITSEPVLLFPSPYR
jgi:hypothetical protein